MPEVETGGDRAYLALPPRPGPGLVLIHEWWGLNPHIRSVADRFAAAGFATLAVDLYAGAVAKTPEEARTLLGRLDEKAVETAVKAGVAFLGVHPSVASPQVGVLGFCMGGRLALLAGCRIEGVGAVVDFYGGANPAFPLDLPAMRAPVLGLFGGLDKSIPPEAIEAVRSGLKAAGKHVEVAVYPEAGHAFFNDTRAEMYNAAAAADAFERATTFLRRFLHAH